MPYSYTPLIGENYFAVQTGEVICTIIHSRFVPSQFSSKEWRQSSLAIIMGKLVTIFRPGNPEMLNRCYAVGTRTSEPATQDSVEPLFWVLCQFKIFSTARSKLKFIQNYDLKSWAGYFPARLKLDWFRIKIWRFKKLGRIRRGNLQRQSRKSPRPPPSWRWLK